MANAPSSFGSAWSCVGDLTMPAVLASGNRIVGEAIARRLQTPRGALLDDPNYGFDLTDFLNADLAPVDIARIAASVEAECVKDERVSAATAQIILAGGVLVTTIQVTTASGPFTLVVSTSAVSTQLLQVTPS